GPPKRSPEPRLFTTSFTPFFWQVTGPATLASGDFNGDRHADFVTHEAYEVDLHLGRGDGTFDHRRVATGSVDDVSIGDVDRDRKLDLVITMDSLHVVVLRGVGDGTFEPPITLDAGAAA